MIYFSSPSPGEEDMNSTRQIGNNLQVPEHRAVAAAQRGDQLNAGQLLHPLDGLSGPHHAFTSHSRAKERCATVGAPGLLFDQAVAL